MSRKKLLAFEIEGWTGVIFLTGLLSFSVPPIVFKVIVLLCGAYSLIFVGKSFTYTREKARILRSYYQKNQSKVFASKKR